MRMDEIRIVERGEGKMRMDEIGREEREGKGR